MSQMKSGEAVILRGGFIKDPPEKPQSPPLPDWFYGTTEERRRRAFDLVLDKFAESIRLGTALSFASAAGLIDGCTAGYFSLAKSSIEADAFYRPGQYAPVDEDMLRIERYNALREQAIASGRQRYRLPDRMLKPGEDRGGTARRRRGAASPTPYDPRRPVRTMTMVAPGGGTVVTVQTPPSPGLQASLSSAEAIEALVRPGRAILGAAAASVDPINQARRSVTAVDRVLAAVEPLPKAERIQVLRSAIALLSPEGSW